MTEDDAPEAQLPTPTIEATFRNGTLTAVSVLLGFSLSFLARWAGLPGQWTRLDLWAVAAISAGIVLEVASVAALLFVGSLALRRYNGAIRLFLVGLGLVALGVFLAIAGDIFGSGQNVVG